MHNAVSDRDFDLRNRVEPALIRFSYIVQKASGFLSRGATVSTHWGGRHKRTHVRTVRIFPDFPSVCASNPSLLSGWFMERRGCSTVRDRAKVLDVGVAKWFDEISIRGENILSSFFLDALKTDGTVVASVGEETVGESADDIFERSVNLLLEYKNGSIMYRDISFLNCIWNDRRAVQLFSWPVLFGNFFGDLWKMWKIEGDRKCVKCVL